MMAVVVNLPSSNVKLLKFSDIKALVNVDYEILVCERYRCKSELQRHLPDPKLEFTRHKAFHGGRK